MRRSRRTEITAWLSTLACAGAFGGCAQSQGEPIVFGSDGSADARADVTKQGGMDATMSHPDSGHDAGVDSTFGFDTYVPPLKDSGLDAGHDAPRADAPRDAGVDARKEAGFDAGFPVYFGPPGSRCSQLGSKQVETCGVCGTQSSLCIARPDGGVPFDAGKVDAAKVDAGPLPDAGPPPFVWGEWGACMSEIDGGCTPGTTTTMACGFCGTLTIVCEPDCQLGATNCIGQVDGGCVAGSTGFEIVPACEADGAVPPQDAGRDAGHDSGVADASAPDASDAAASDAAKPDAAASDATQPDSAPPKPSPIVAGKAQTCSATCEWKTSPKCELPPSTLTIAPEPSGKVTTIVNFSPTEESLRLALAEFGEHCPTSPSVNSMGQTLEVPYGLVTVKNSSATQAAVVSAWSWQVPDSVAVTTYITAYATAPTTQAQFNACTGVLTDTCDDQSDPTSCVVVDGGSFESNYGGLMLGDGNELTIPAGGSIVIYLADEKNLPADIGPVELTVRTESFTP